VLQQHVAFFDRNNDGYITPWETYLGFRAVGFNVLWSAGAMFVINGAFSWSTQNTWLPSPTFTIHLRNIHRAKHGSDSEVYDTEGRFVITKFEELFSKFDHGRKGALTFFELLELTEANRNAADPFGWTAEKLEWGLTYLLLKDEHGLVSKEKIRGMYDGSVFYAIEAERQARAQKKVK
jgi:peroxygenase